MLTLKESSEPVTVKLHEKFQIVEDSNHTTGYSWTIDGFKPLPESKFEVINQETPFEIHEHEYITARSGSQDGPKMCGGGGQDKFIVSARKSGKHQLVLLYKRPWETSHAKEIKFDLVVEG